MILTKQKSRLDQMIEKVAGNDRNLQVYAWIAKNYSDISDFFEKYEPEPDVLDEFFQMGFITVRLGEDMYFIANEFFANYREQIPEFTSRSDLTLFQDMTDVAEYLPCGTLKIIWQGFRSGHEYCRDFLLALYKTYHKSEYQILKRFSSVTLEEVQEIVGDKEREMVNAADLARVLGMCEVMGITCDEGCKLLYLAVQLSDDEKKAESERTESKRKNLQDKINSYREEAEQHYSEWMNYQNLKNRYDNPLISFTKKALLNAGFCEKFNCGVIDNIYKKSILSHEFFIQTYALYKIAFPDEEIDWKKFEIYAFITTFAFQLMLIEYHFEMCFSILTFKDGSNDTDRSDKVLKILPDYAAVEYNVPEHIAQLPVYTDQEPTETANAKKEIEDLKTKLRIAESESAALRKEKTELKEQLDKTARELEDAESDHKELIALRNFVFNLQNSDTDISEDADFDEKKAFIRDKKIMIIGGHQNWTKKIKQEYKNWTLIAAGENSVGVKPMSGYDMVFFFSEHIDHCLYNSYMSVIRERSIPLGYIYGVNDERVVSQIYEQLTAGEEE